VPELLARHTTAVWVTVAVALVAAEGILGTEETGGWNRWTFLVFLALGVLLAIQPRLGEPMAQRRRLIVVYALVGFVALAASGELLQDHLGGTLSTSQALDPMLWRACKGITGLLFLMAIVGSLVGYESQRPAPAAQGASRTSAFLSYMGRISLPVYIVHQTFVVLLGFWILQLSIPAPVQWLALAVLTLALSVSTVEIASRTRLGRLLLGMRPRHRKPESAAPSVAVKPPARQPAGREPELVPSPLV
jgi:glucan biosynthesis protein C